MRSNPIQWSLPDLPPAPTVSNGRFTPHECALGDAEGVALLHDPKIDGGSERASLVAAAVDALYSGQMKRTVPVKMRTLDRVAEDHKISRIDYLKIDAEGFDLHVLRGAQQLIADSRIGVVQFEFNTMNVFSRTFMHDFLTILPRHRMHRIVQDGLVALGDYNPVTWELFGYQNIVALPYTSGNDRSPAEIQRA
jgi:FkbM family methyltransferase